MSTSGGTSGITSPLTTKGDVWGFSSASARIPVGSDTQVLTADSTQPLGVKWAAAGAAASLLNEVQAAVLLNATSPGDAGNRAVHFTGAALPSGWVQEATAANTLVVGYSALSIHPGSGANHVLAPYTPTNACDVVIRGGMMPVNQPSNPDGFGLLIRDSGTGDASGNGVLAQFQISSAQSATAGLGTAQLQLITLDAGVYTVRQTQSLVYIRGSFVYLRLLADVSQNWLAAVSIDRVTWLTTATSLKALAVAKVGVRTGQFCNFATYDFFDVAA